MERNKYWDSIDVENLSSPQSSLLESLQIREDFAVIGDIKGYIYEHATNAGYEIIEINLKKREDLIGERIFGKMEGIGYFDNYLPWLEHVCKHPDKQFLIIYIVDDADKHLINGIKHYCELHHKKNGPHNFFIGVICADESCIKNTTTYPLLNKIRINRK